MGSTTVLKWVIPPTDWPEGGDGGPEALETAAIAAQSVALAVVVPVMANPRRMTEGCP